MSSLDDVGDLNLTAADHWLASRRNTHRRRTLVAQQTTLFYRKRRTIEYSIKATISSTMTLALIYGGPPVWIMGGAIIMLKLATEILNRYTPKQYIDIEQLSPDLLQASQASSETQASVIICQQLIKKQQNHMHDQQEQASYFLQKKIALALIVGYALFTIFSGAMTLPVMAAGIIFTLALIEQANEERIPFVEEESELGPVIN